MLKKMLYSFLISVSILLCATATVSAMQYTTLPANLRYGLKGVDYVDLITFSVDKVYAISSSQNRVEFSVGYYDPSGYGHEYIQFNCYDSNGKYIEKRMYKKGEAKVLDVSNKTATIEITVSNQFKELWQYAPDSYLYRKTVTVYAKDGRTMEITDLMVPSYEAIGWYPAVTLYSMDGRAIEIPKYQKADYMQVGWYEEPFKTLYTLDGRSELVPESKVKAYKEVGWYEEPVIMMYSLDNRTKVVLQSKIEANMKVGWYTAPVVKVYTLDGREDVIVQSDLQYYVGAGWYTEKPVKLYALDGRMIRVLQADVQAYLSAGWYTQPVTVMYSLDGRSQIVCKADVEANKEVGWYEEPVVMVYAINGTSMVIPQTNLNACLNNGWYTQPVVVLYSLDGRTEVVAQSDVNAYLSVGWYTLDGLTYQNFLNQINQYKASGNYNEIFNYIDENAEQLKNTQYAQEVYVLRTQAMDWWRVAIGRPMGVIEYQTGKNSADVPTATITFRNVSYKKILAFKLKFTCYNIFGEVEETYYSYYFDDNANIKSGDTYQTTWTLHGADSVYSLSGIKVTEVVFEDGTKWTGN